MLGEGDVIDMVVGETPGLHAVALGGGGVERPGAVDDQHLFVPLLGVACSDVGREV